MEHIDVSSSDFSRILWVDSGFVSLWKDAPEEYIDVSSSDFSRILWVDSGFVSLWRKAPEEYIDVSSSDFSRILWVDSGFVSRGEKPLKSTVNRIYSHFRATAYIARVSVPRLTRTWSKDKKKWSGLWLYARFYLALSLFTVFSTQFLPVSGQPSLASQMMSEIANVAGPDSGARPMRASARRGAGQSSSGPNGIPLPPPPPGIPGELGMGGGGQRSPFDQQPSEPPFGTPMGFGADAGFSGASGGGGGGNGWGGPPGMPQIDGMVQMPSVSMGTFQPGPQDSSGGGDGAGQWHYFNVTECVWREIALKVEKGNLFKINFEKSQSVENKTL